MIALIFFFISGHLNPVHRTKRDLHSDFVQKPIIFVKGERKPSYN